MRLILTGAALLSSQLLSAQTLRTDTLVAPAMLTDLDSIAELVATTHVDPTYYASEVAWQNALEWAEHTCSQPLTRAEWASVVARLLRTLEDSHTYLNFGSLIKASQADLPWTVDLTFAAENDTVYVVNDLSGQLQPGTQVLRWNTLPMSEALSDVRNYGIREGASTHASEAVHQVLLGNLLPLLVPVDSTNALEVLIDGSPASVSYDARNASAKRPRKERHDAPPTWSLEMEGSLAVLKVRSFSSGGTGAFYRFLRRSFKQLEQAGVEHLVLDIRQNTGGSSGRMEALMRFVLADSLAIPNRIAVRQSPNSKALLESKAGRIKLWLMQRMAKRDEQVAHYLRMRELPIGARDTLVYTAKPPIEKHRFDGKCYLLMDGLSGSASVSMASVFRQYDRGLILGTPCLGPMSGTWGNPAVVHLPETELDIVVSTLRFDATGHFDRRPTSILPDHWLAPTRLDVAVGTDVCLDFLDAFLAIPTP